jgi:hypothetical protein
MTRPRGRPRKTRPDPGAEAPTGRSTAAPARAAPAEPSAPIAGRPLATKLHRWHELSAAALDAPEIVFSRDEAREEADAWQGLLGVAGVALEGPTWEIVSAALSLIALYGSHYLAWRLRVMAQTPAPAPPSTGPAQPPAAPAPGPTISPVPAAPRPQPAPVMPPLDDALVTRLAANGTTGFGVPGMPVMSLSDRLAPP